MERFQCSSRRVPLGRKVKVTEEEDLLRVPHALRRSESHELQELPAT